MKTLYVSDLDGTLLDNEGLVSPRSAKILSQLSDEGAVITVATARTPATVVPLMTPANTRIPYIVMTGAATYDPVSGRYENLHALDVEQVADAAYVFSRHGINPFFYHLSDDSMLTAYHTPAMTPAERRFYEARANTQLKRFTFNPILPTGGKYPLIFAVAETEALEPIAREFRETDIFQVSFYPDITMPGISLIELFAKGVDKALTTTLMASKLDAGRIVAFGDNLNDLPLFEAADVSVAVENAHPAVKEAADVVIGPNYEDSVARFIAYDFKK